MFNRRFEAALGSRSEETLRNSLYTPSFYEPGSYLPIVDNHSLELAATFREEERLASLIAEAETTTETGPASKTVSKATIYQVVAMARRVAQAGFPTALVSPDEMLDIAEIYQSTSPAESLKNQVRLFSTPKDEYPYANPYVLVGMLIERRVHGPEKTTAAEALVDLLSKLDENENPVWAARVAAALAYFSVQETP